MLTIGLYVMDPESPDRQRYSLVQIRVFLLITVSEGVLASGNPNESGCPERHANRPPRDAFPLNGSEMWLGPSLHK